VAPGLGHEQSAALGQALVDFPQQGTYVRDFMDGPEGQHEIDRFVDSNGITLALMRANSRGDTGPLGPFLKDLEHLRLQINCDHVPLVPEHLGHRDGKEPHAAAKVHHGHTLPDVTGEYLFGLVKKTAEAIVNEEAAPPRTDVFGHVLSRFRLAKVFTIIHDQAAVEYAQKG
jgi:hypothetical protein